MYAHAYIVISYNPDNLFAGYMYVASLPAISRLFNSQLKIVYKVKAGKTVATTKLFWPIIKHLHEIDL